MKSLVCGSALLLTTLLFGVAGAADHDTTEIAGLAVGVKAPTTNGTILPNQTFPILVSFEAGSDGSGAVTIDVSLHAASKFVNSTPAPASRDGQHLRYSIPALPSHGEGKITIEAQAKTLQEDPQIMWKSLEASVAISAENFNPVVLRTLGPKVTDLKSARFGDRPYPVVMVQYQDVKHCSDVGKPFPECTGNHTAEALDVAVNSRTSGRSVWQLYSDMSFGQLQAIGEVLPAPGAGTTNFDPAYPHKWSQLAPNGTCHSVTLASSPTYPGSTDLRIQDGWYQLPGTQGYYGADAFGHAAVGMAVGSSLLAGIDNACGAIAKIAYDAASIADPDVDYNMLDTDKDGVVDLFNVIFAGASGQGLGNHVSGVDNIWPHQSDIRQYFIDENGVRGYVSHDQLTNHSGQPLFYTDATRTAFTTTDTGIPAYVLVGPYNASPESSIEFASVLAHEYGHSLGLPDFYSLTGSSTYGDWTLMAWDAFQFMDVFARQELGWIVPQPMRTGEITLRESKFDTGEIHWQEPDGTPYVLTGEGIHNADAYRLGLAPQFLIDKVPSGSHAWYSGRQNNLPCPPAPAAAHVLDIEVPELGYAYKNAKDIRLRFQSRYEIEWDYDYGFVLASTDGGQTWMSLSSDNGTTLSVPFNPNSNACFSQYGNGITGVSGGGENSPTNPNRLQSLYPAPQFVEDSFDLSALAGKPLILRFAYVTDSGTIHSGWFVDDIEITADGDTIYSSDFEAGERGRVFESGWALISSQEASPADHAFYLSLRDRVGFDFDGKGQSDLGPPRWSPGVYLMRTDENAGYGNITAPNPPPQTPIDARPDPLTNAPNLNDAAFDLAQPQFNGCTHIDNYSADPDLTVPWKLPSDLSFFVTRLEGLSPGPDVPATPATATLRVKLYPDCDLELLPPELRIESGYEAPDMDGTYQLSWTRPAGATPPDTLQEATEIRQIFADPAEDPLIAGANALWQASPNWVSAVNPDNGSLSYYAPDLVSQDESLTLISPLKLPVGEIQLQFSTRQQLDAGFHFGIVEVSTDAGASWTAAASYSGPGSLGSTPLEAFVGRRIVDLARYGGQAVLLRFRLTSDELLFGPKAGWWIDDIAITSANYVDVVATDDTKTTLRNRSPGHYFYRVRTTYPNGPASLGSGYSNTVEIDVANGRSSVDSQSGGSSGPVRGGTADLIALAILAFLSWLSRKPVRQGRPSKF